jgi:hypothetical protein
MGKPKAIPAIPIHLFRVGWLGWELGIGLGHFTIPIEFHCLLFFIPKEFIE